jgi:hypothetical protein
MRMRNQRGNAQQNDRLEGKRVNHPVIAGINEMPTFQL